MRLPTLLLLTLLCTCVRAQTMRVDTVAGPSEGYQTLRYITEMPAEAEMSKAERFMRGMKGAQGNKPWDRLDSLVIFDATGKRVKLPASPPSYAPSLPTDLYYFDQDVVTLEGRIGARKSHAVSIENAFSESRVLRRVDEHQRLRMDREVIRIPGKESLEFEVFTDLPEGSLTQPLRLQDGDNTVLEIRFVLVGHDLNETDFVNDAAAAAASPWMVPEGRETLFLRLRSTEKLMTIYKNGEQYSKVAVGRQLDEVNLSGLGIGDYLLEVIDLGTGQRRYYGLRRTRSGSR